MKHSLRSLLIPIYSCFIFLLVGCGQTQVHNGKVIDKQKALDSYITLGMAYLERGSRDASRRNFEKAMEIEPNSHRALNGLALLQKLNGELSLAEASFKKAIRRNAKYTEARVNYGVFLYQQERYQEAYDQFEAASEDLSFNRRSLLLTYLGQAALKLDLIERAKSAFEYAINLDDKQAQARLELAELSFAEEDYAKTKQYLDEYSQLAKSSPQSLWLGIRIERIFGNKNKEASYALALRNLHPYSKEYLEYKSMLDEQ